MNKSVVMGLVGLVGLAVIPAGIYLHRSGEAPPEDMFEFDVMPAPDEIMAPAVNEAPSFDVVRVNRKGEAVLAGRAIPNAEVTISNRGREIGKVTTDYRGEWVWVSETPFPPGDLELSLSSRLGDDEPVLSENVVVMILPQSDHDIAGRASGRDRRGRPVSGRGGLRFLWSDPAWRAGGSQSVAACLSQQQVAGRGGGRG